MLLVSFSFLALALENNTNIQLNKGWNLVSGFSGLHSQINSDSDINLENIKAVYAYFAPAQQYVGLGPNADSEEKIDRLEQTYNADDDLLMYSANWVYSDKEGYLRYNQYTLDMYGIESLNELEIFKGWNFVTITEEMIESSERSIFSIKDLAGTCDIQKSYVWDVDKQQWLAAPLESFDFGIDGVGLGWVIKVSNNCKLGTSGGNIPSIPNLP